MMGAEVVISIEKTLIVWQKLAQYVIKILIKFRYA